MPIQPGTRLGPYEISAAIGAGGMGEVYRARDTRLDRDVAIKVLPQDFATDADRLARFEREAKLLAQLNHPNIAAIYGLEDEGEISFLAMELAEGQTLAQRLSDGAIGIDEALKIAMQIAEALEAAHERGIVHRDLKPANIQVATEGSAAGQVKVLDFGLAKAFEADGTSQEISPELSASPTMAAVTRTGVIMGTAAYMSPEQARGKPVDKRADIWAFGCVLYEALTGKRAFHGETVTDILAAIVHREPQWEALPPETPVRIRDLLKRCLRKQPDERLRDVGECRIAVKEYLADPEGEKRRALASAGTVIEAANPWKLAIPLAVAPALLAALGVWFMTPSPPEPLTRRFHIDYPPETSFGAGSSLGVALSPDGKSVVFRDTQQLWLRAIDDPVATPIRGTENARVPFFSPDSQQLGFWGSEGQMKSVSITGGAPVSLGPAPARAYGASWADDGYIYFGQGPGGILRVSATGGDPEVVVPVQEGERAHGPQLLPGGEWLLFALSTGGSWNEASIVAQRLSDGERKVLVAGGTDGRYVPTGHIVYSLQSNLFAVPFDADRIEVTGGSASIVEGVQQATGLTGAGQYAFSDRGGLVYLPSSGGAAGDYQLAWVDRNDQVELLPFEPRRSQNLDLSPDGESIALEIQGDDGEWDIWIYEVDRGGSGVLLTTEGNNRFPVWSPDGEWVFFGSDRDGNSDIWKQPADRSQPAELVLDTVPALLPMSISADGEALLFDSGPSQSRDVGMLALDSDQEPEMLVASARGEFAGSFSPDGRFFAFSSAETGQVEVYVRELSSGRTFRVSTSTRGGGRPRWSRDGREIYYNSRVGPGILVAEVTLEPFSASDPVELSDIRTQFFTNFDVTADGQRFLVTVPAGGGDIEDTAAGTRLNVVLNWFEELKERVPTGGR